MSDSDTSSSSSPSASEENDSIYRKPQPTLPRIGPLLKAVPIPPVVPSFIYPPSTRDRSTTKGYKSVAQQQVDAKSKQQEPAAKAKTKPKTNQKPNAKKELKSKPEVVAGGSHPPSALHLDDVEIDLIEYFEPGEDEDPALTPGQNCRRLTGKDLVFDENPEDAPGQLAPKDKSLTQALQGDEMNMPISIERMMSSPGGPSLASLAPSKAGTKRKTAAEPADHVSKKAKSDDKLPKKKSKIEKRDLPTIDTVAGRQQPDAADARLASVDVKKESPDNGTTSRGDLTRKEWRKLNKKNREHRDALAGVPKPADVSAKTKEDETMLKKITMASKEEVTKAGKRGTDNLAGPLRKTLEADAKIQSLEEEIEALKGAVKDVVKYGGMLDAENHGKLGSAMQTLKKRLKN